ncbi:MAG: VWA domain-containing protein [Thiohalocapsa sp.]|nr:VWA domain-containing protein [Thiohalocapsa sp.]
MVLDVSESMAGTNREQLEEAIGTIVATLRTNAQALDTVYLSVIAFAGIARTLVDLCELPAFRAPPLPIGGGTALGAALELVMDEIDRQVVRGDSTRKGDWRPIVYLFTDGKPTDDVNAARERWQSRYLSRVDLVAVAMGEYADQAVLATLTNHIFTFDPKVTGGFEVFVRWLTESVSMQSERVGDPDAGRISLAKVDNRAIALARPRTDEAPSADADADCVVMVGRCQNTARPYLVKYDRYQGDAVSTEFLEIPVEGYRITGAYPLTEEYFDWTRQGASGGEASTADLEGAAACPCCGNPITIAQCRCGHLLCLAGPGEAHCPWCHADVYFQGGGEDDFTIQRGQG